MSIAGIVGLGFGAAAGSVLPPPAAPGLSVVDGGDGSAVATITGGTPTATHTVYAASVSDPSAEPVEVGSRTGNGTVSFSLASGVYYAYAIASLHSQSAASAAAIFRVTDGEKSLHWQICKAVQDELLLLALPGIPADKVLLRKHLLRCVSQIGAAGAIVGPIPETLRPIDNGRDEVGYGVLILIAKATDQSLGPDEEFDSELGWRETVQNALSEGGLATSIPEVKRVQVTPGSLNLPGAFASNYDAHVLRLVAYVDRLRDAHS
jgi:hypothetical protein